MVEQKEFNAQLSEKIHTEENSLDQRLDGLKDDFEHKWDNLQDSIEDLIDQQECPPEEDCQKDIKAKEQRVVTVQANQETETVESSLNKELDGFQSEINQKLDIQQESILKLTNQFVHQEEKNLEEESQEDESLTEIILVEQVQLQPQEELKEESLETPEELQDAPVNFWPWTKEEQIRALITEESSGHEGTQENIFPLPPTDSVYILPLPAPQSQPKTPTANAQATYNPLPVYILPAENSKPAAPAPKGKSNPLSAMQKFKELVAINQIFATTSNKMAAAHTAWHSGWFGCRFGFGAPGPRHL